MSIITKPLNFRYILKKDLSEVGSLPLLIGHIYARPSNPDLLLKMREV